MSSEGMKRNTQLSSGEHYLFDLEYLYIKLDEMYPFYVSYCRINNYKISDNIELRNYLTAKTYKPFVKGNRKDSPNVVAHIHSKLGSCLRYRYHKIQNQKYIGEIEINIPHYETS